MKNLCATCAMLTAAVMLLNSCGFSSERKMVDPSKITYAESYSFDKIRFDGIEKMDVSILLEAEDAKSATGVTVKTDKSDYSGSGYVDISENSAFSLSVDIPASQFYKITVRHRADGHKENPLMFNGLKALDIYSDSDDWTESEVNGIFLEKGKNEITLGSGWSWFSLDSILIETGESLKDDIYGGVSETLSNPYANLKTQNIYQYLKAIYGKRTLAGQCTDYGHNTETDALYKGLGKYPAVRTFDFIFDSPSYCNGNPPATDVDLAIEWSRDGGLVAYDWHWHAPFGGATFYAKDTSFDLSRAVTDEDLAHMDIQDIKQLQKDKKITREAYEIVSDIDAISKLMQHMEIGSYTAPKRVRRYSRAGYTISRHLSM